MIRKLLQGKTLTHRRYSDLTVYITLVVCFLLGNSPTSEFHMPTFRNTLSVPSSWASRCEELIIHTYLPMQMEQSVQKRRHITIRRQEITQQKAHNIQNTAKVWNQEYITLLGDQNPLISDWEHLRHNWTDAAEDDNGNCFRNVLLFLEWQLVYQVPKSLYPQNSTAFPFGGGGGGEVWCSTRLNLQCLLPVLLWGNRNTRSQLIFLHLRGLTVYLLLQCLLQPYCWRRETSQFHWHKIFNVPQIGRETVSACVILSLCK
jgi:hypothetical protein